MQISKVLVAAAMATAAVGVLAGCSGSGSSSISPVVPTSHGVRQAMSHDATGIAPKFLSIQHYGSSLPSIRPNSGALKFLAVADAGTGAVEILNASYVLTSTITTGLNGPDGDWYDQHKNLYVANYSGPYVQEYAPGGSTPSFTYSTGLGDPINVATDEHGHVFAIDYNFGSPGFVNEYAQNSNTVMHTCSLSGGGEGIAIGETGQVFISYNNPAGGANIVEYKHGLSGCTGTTLGVALNFAGGLQLDNHKNLVACDQTAGAVDIIAPPYGSVTSSITGFADPFHVALNKANTLVFVADAANADVAVDNYPSGTSVTILNGSNGLSLPYGVATTPFQH
jgi:hypothetical protein